MPRFSAGANESKTPDEHPWFITLNALHAEVLGLESIDVANKLGRAFVGGGHVAGDKNNRLDAVDPSAAAATAAGARRKTKRTARSTICS